jgi:hypothetical protein
LQNIDFSPLEASLRLGKDQIVAKSDGGVQIIIAGRDENGNETSQEVIYERAYYQLAIEVTPPMTVFDHKSKRFFERRKKASDPLDIVESAPTAPVFAGQIFAEMLAGINHPEYFSTSDQEVYSFLYSTYEGICDSE